MKWIRYVAFALAAVLVCLPAAVVAETPSAAASQSPGSTPAVTAAGDDTFYPDDGVVPSQLGADEETDPVFLITYEKIAENNRLAMYADKAKGLFAVKNKVTGKVWYSTPRDTLLDPKTKGKAKMNLQSQMLVYFIYREDENTNIDLQVENSQVSCINRGTVKTELMENGIRVHYIFGNQGFRIPVEYTLGEDYLSARIDMENLVEGDQCFLVSIHLLPTMGAGNWEDEGYLFVPDGSGAIVNFNNNISMPQNYEVPIYGEDLGIVKNTSSSRAQTVNMPVFGTVTGQDALMGVVTQGDAASSLYIYNGNASTGYNAISTKLVLRSHNVIESFYVTNRQNDILQISHTPYLQDGYEVRYYPLSGEDASYVGMAKRYRSYLETKGLTANPQKLSLALDMYGAVTLKANFLGITYQKLTPLTTFSQAEEILAELKGEGVDALNVRYRGWTGNGLLNKRILTKTNPLRKLGGSKGFASLLDYCADEGVTLYPEIDFLQFSGWGSASRTPAGDPALQYEYMLSVYETKINEKPLKLLTPAKLVQSVKTLMASYNKLDVSGLAVGSIGNKVYSDFSKKVNIHRGDLPEIYGEALSHIGEQQVSQAFQSANAYALPYADYIYEAPIYSSNYDIFAQDVPFYQIVLHGYVPMSVPAVLQSVEPRVTLLKAVETGSDLLYSCTETSAAKLSESRFADLYGATYDLWKEDAVEAYQAMKPLFDDIYNKPIVGHAQVAEDVFVTTYEGGIRVAVNYNEEPVEVAGQTIEAFGFARLEGAA